MIEALRSASFLFWCFLLFCLFLSFLDPIDECARKCSSVRSLARVRCRKLLFSRLATELDDGEQHALL